MASPRPLALVLLLGLGGCNVLGALAAKTPKPDIEAAYKGLAGKSVGIMVWADKNTLMDWPNLQLEVGNTIYQKLLAAQDAKVKELKDTTFPYEPASFIKYQRQHPEIDTMNVTQLAPKLGVQRLIYVEINDLTTRAEGGSTLFLGRVNVALKIVEIENGTGKLAYPENNIKAQFPESATAEGVANGNDRAMYGGALNLVTTEIVKRLIQHPDETP